MVSILLKAAKEFLAEEKARRVRPKFSVGEQAELAAQVTMIERAQGSSESFTSRGLVAIEAVGYATADFEDRATNVITDILHACEQAGLEPLTVLAHARAEFFRDKGLGELGLPSEGEETDVWPVPGEERA